MVASFLEWVTDRNDHTKERLEKRMEEVGTQKKKGKFEIFKRANKSGNKENGQRESPPPPTLLCSILPTQMAPSGIDQNKQLKMNAMCHQPKMQILIIPCALQILRWKERWPIECLSYLFFSLFFIVLFLCYLLFFPQFIQLMISCFVSPHFIPKKHPLW